MSFLASFVTGFATQAQKDIEERDKELRDEATVRWNSLLKEREKAKLRAEQRSTEIDDAARKLRAYGITDEKQIVAAISSGTASEIIDKLSSMKEGLTTAKAQQLIKIEPEQEIPSLAEFRKKATELQPGLTAAPSEEQMRGAFGLKTRAYEQSLKSASAQTGVGLEEIYKTKLPDVPTIRAIVDLTALGTEKERDFNAQLSTARLRYKQALASKDQDAIDEAKENLDYFTTAAEFGKKEKKEEQVLSKPQDTINELVAASDLLTRKASELRSSGNAEDVKNASQLDQFAKNYTTQANDIFKKIPRKADGGEPADTFKNLATFRSDFRGMFSTATESAQTKIGGAGFVPGVNPVTGERTLTYTGTDPKAWEAIYEERRKLMENYVATVKEQAGRIPPAMIVAASGMGVNITADGKINVQRLGKESASTEPTTTAPAAPGLGARAKPAATAPATTSGADPIPTKTENGKTVIDGTKLVAGKKYMDPNTKQVKTWNGTRFE